MQLYEMQVTKTTIYRTAPVKIPKGILGAVVKLSFSAEWEGLSKTVVFRAGEVTKDVVGVEEFAVIPAECTQELGQLLEVGVYGVDGDNTVAIPTMWAAIGRITEAADPSGDETTDPSLPVWAQLAELIRQLEEQGATKEETEKLLEMVTQLKELSATKIETEKLLEMVTQLEKQGVTQRQIEAALRDFFGGERPTGKTTPDGGEIFNFYTDPVYTGDEPPKEFPGNTANKGAHAQNFGTHADGEYSSASGWNSTASGGVANATGRETLASGYAATTEGQSTTASGRCSHAGGKGTKAAGENAFAFGEETEASGKNSFAGGLKSKAAKAQAVAIGNTTEASGANSFAGGVGTKATASQSIATGNGAEATGVNAFSHGVKTKSTSNTSVAIGEETEAGGFYAIASGYRTKAKGTCTMAGGRDTEVTENAYAATAMGRGTIANSRYQFVRGQYNEPDVPDPNKSYLGQYAEIVGNGTASVPKNIYTLDWAGNANFAGKIYSGGVEVAPGGFGLGGSVTIPDGYDWNTCTATGWYAAKNNAPEANIWYFGEVNRLGNSALVQKAFRQLNNISDSAYYLSAERRGVSADNGKTWVWSEWEWVNPRMIPGVEYRTVEKYDSKPVYAKLISFGKLPNSETAYISAVSSRVHVVSLHGIAKVGNETNHFPVIAAGQIVAYAFTQITGGETGIHVRAVMDASAYTAEFVLKYTKD